MDVAPNGLAFYSGPDQTLRALNPSGTGTWQTFGQRDSINRDYGGHAIFDIGKILVAGGGPSTNDARVVDINGTDAPGLVDCADGLRPTPAQPHRPRRRIGPGNGRQLLGRLARRPQRGRLSGRAVEPRHRSMAHPGRDAGHAPVPLDRAATARRARALRRRRDLQHLRHGRAIWRRTPRSSRRPTSSRRTARSLRARRSTPHRRQRPTARRWRSRPGSGLDQQGRPRPTRGRHALEQHGAALCPVVLHRRSDNHHGDGSGQLQHRAAGHLHALHHRRERRAFGRAHGQRSGQFAARWSR